MPTEPRASHQSATTAHLNPHVERQSGLQRIATSDFACAKVVQCDANPRPGIAGPARPRCGLSNSESVIRAWPNQHNVEAAWDCRIPDTLCGSSLADVSQLDGAGIATARCRKIKPRATAKDSVISSFSHLNGISFFKLGSQARKLS